MKNNFKMFLSVLLLFLVLGTNANAENKNLFGRPKAVAFKGDTQNWFVVHRMYLIGTEIYFETKIRYKGNDSKIKKSTSLYYSVLDKKGISVFHGDIFSLDKSNEFKSERMDCYGCKYLDSEEKITFIINEWQDNEETLILKRE